MQKAVPIPAIQHCIDTLGQDEGEKVHKLMARSDFRCAQTLLEQINYLKAKDVKITVRSLIKLLGISNDAYYRAIRNIPISAPTVRILPSRLLLTPEEEQEIVRMIHEQQTQNDCWSSKDIRDFASSLFKEKTGEDRSFSREWFFDFKTRHKNEIEKIKACCVDDLRAEISIDEVERYFEEIEEMLQDPPIPPLLINFDETGFGRRPEKGKKKTVYVSKRCKVKPFWREQQDLHHISVVTAITASCFPLRYMCLSTRKTSDDDLEDTFFRRWSELYQTKKGYMTKDSMVYWVKHILAPYVDIVRSIFGQENKCVVIADGCTSHFHEDVLNALEEIGNIRMIALPPHYSHLTQMLDCSVFASVKKKYSSIPSNKNYESRYTRKLMKIKKAFESSINSELIRAAWESTGFQLNIVYGEVSSYTFSEEFKSFLRAEALHQDPQ